MIDLNKKNIEIMSKIIELTQKDKIIWKRAGYEVYRAEFTPDKKSLYTLYMDNSKNPFLNLSCAGVKYSIYNQDLIEDLNRAIKYRVDQVETRMLLNMIDAFLKNSI